MNETLLSTLRTRLAAAALALLCSATILGATISLAYHYDTVRDRVGGLDGLATAAEADLSAAAKTGHTAS